MALTLCATSCVREGEEKTTNVFVIITQNGVSPLQTTTNQQIVVVNPDQQAKTNMELLPEMDGRPHVCGQIITLGESFITK
jgi:hypothetical protein